MNPVIARAAVRLLMSALLLAAFSCAHEEVRVVLAEMDPNSYHRAAEGLTKLVKVMDVTQEEKYGVMVLAQDQPNAYAFDDYTVAVNRGLLRLLTDDELLCILAHEIAHLSLGHHSRKRAVSSSKTLVFSELDRINPDVGTLGAIFKPLSVKAYSREQELEADIEAVRALRVFGISYEVYVGVLRKLEEAAKTGGYGSGGGIMDTHPSFEDRVEKIRRVMAQ